MSGKGRKKLPDIVKISRGQTKPSRMSGDKPVFNLFTVDSLPPAPNFLNETGKQVYLDTVKQLIELRLVNSVNFPLIIAYANNIGIYYEAETYMRQKTRLSPVRGPEGDIIKLNVSPYHKIANDALDRALRIASEFGITPSAQTKIMSLIKPPEEVNPFLNI